MRYLSLDVLAVRSDQSRQRYVSIVNRQFESFSDQRFDESHHWRFTQIVSSGFEAETEYTNALLSAPHDHLDRALDLETIARQDRSEHRRFDVQFLGLVVYRAQIFGQTRSAKRETRFQIVRR